MTQIINRRFPLDPSDLLPAITPETQPFWTALSQGHVSLQTCSACRRPRHPVAPVCPYCDGRDFSWQAVAGRGTLFSWVRYHRSFLPEFEVDLPYVVATVALDEGPRMFGFLHGSPQAPEIGAPVSLVIERWPGGRCVAAFDYGGRKDNEGSRDVGAGPT